MNRPTLEERLTRLASAGFGQGVERTLRANDSDALVRSILIEADSVVMPREIRLRGTGKGTALEVANRRLLRARALDGNKAPVVLEAADPAQMETVRGLIVEAIGASSMVRLGHWPLDREIDPAEPGMSIQALAGAWGISLEQADTDDAAVLDRFLSGAAKALPAWIMLSGDVTESFGDERLIDELLPMSEGGLAAAVRDQLVSDRWRFIAVGTGTRKTPHAAIAMVGETMFMMSIARGRLGVVADAWRAALT